MNKPLVSVVMPAYNTELYIAEAIESILNQTFPDFEFIIINDGSTDNTLEIIRQYEAQDGRIRGISRQNRGIAASLNEGITLATGKYIARMDADDISLPQRLEKQVAFMEAHPEVGVCGSRMLTIGLIPANILSSPLPNEEIQAITAFFCPVNHPSVILRRELLIKYKINYVSEYEPADDYHLWARLIDLTEFANLPEILVRYRLNNGQLTSRQSKKMYDNSTRVKFELLERKLGIQPTQEELNTAILVSNLTIKNELEFVKKAEKWLLKLLTANEEKKGFPEPYFSKRLKTYWFELCYSNTASGFSVWRTYYGSRLRKNNKVEFKKHLKFAIKCFLRKSKLILQAS